MYDELGGTSDPNMRIGIQLDPVYVVFLPHRTQVVWHTLLGLIIAKV